MEHNDFRSFILRNDWTFAKTYAAFCPHEYLVKNRANPNDQSQFAQIAQFIRDKGFIASYGNLGPNWYYIVDDYYYWTMDKETINTDLINRAKLSDFDFIETDHGTIVRRHHTF